MSMDGQAIRSRHRELPDAELETRVSEFERLHAPDVMAGGPGWVPRIETRDYAIAAAVNLVLIGWLVAVLVWG